MLIDEHDTTLDRLPVRLVERAQALNGGPLPDEVAILLLSLTGVHTATGPAAL